MLDTLLPDPEEPMVEDRAEDHASTGARIAFAQRGGRYRRAGWLSGLSLLHPAVCSGPCHARSVRSLVRRIHRGLLRRTLDDGNFERLHQIRRRVHRAPRLPQSQPASLDRTLPDCPVLPDRLRHFLPALAAHGGVAAHSPQPAGRCPRSSAVGGRHLSRLAQPGRLSRCGRRRAEDRHGAASLDGLLHRRDDPPSSHWSEWAAASAGSPRLFW